MLPAEHERPADLEARIRGCRICREQPLGAPLDPEPHPILVLSQTARVCVAGQAPGARAHRSGIPFTDPSGDRLRDWMGLDGAAFYDRARIAIVPMGFCFPGLDAAGGDRPPRRECARTWHDGVFAAMPQVELVLLVGGHAQRWHGRRAGISVLGEGVEAAVRAWREILASTSGPQLLPLPHPSWRNNAWLRRHPWFERDLVPDLRHRIAELT